jgi:hypothetical protein
MEIVKFRDWILEVDKDLTIETYSNVFASGSDSCGCDDCKNYILNRNNVFPDEIKKMFQDLGVDYNKEVEILSYEILPNGLHHIAGWFHFKGRILEGKDCKAGDENGTFQYNLTEIGGDFLMGFCKQNSLTFFENKEGLIQIEFEANIPWVFDKLKIQ